jgi:hypothetical protein
MIVIGSLTGTVGYLFQAPGGLQLNKIQVPGHDFWSSRYYLMPNRV